MDNLKEIIKATLFVAGEGIDISSFVQTFGISKNEVLEAISLLKSELSGNNGIHIIEYKNKIQLSSNPMFSEQISSVLNPIREKALTKAALETLAIIAYKQPITKLEIEEIRGVNCDYTVQILSEHKMIDIVGRKDALGRPLLYGTTEEFLKRFNLINVDSLPDYNSLLERIALIRTDEPPKTDELYNQYNVSNEKIIYKNNKAEDKELLEKTRQVLSSIKIEDQTKIFEQVVNN